MPWIGKGKALALVAVVTAASCSLISDDDDEAVIDAEQTFCGDLAARMGQYEAPYTMGEMADIYSGLEPPQGLESEYQVFVDLYLKLDAPDFVYDEEATQWVESNEDDLEAVHDFISEECDIDLGTPTTQAP